MNLEPVNKLIAKLLGKEENVAIREENGIEKENVDRSEELKKEAKPAKKDKQQGKAKGIPIGKVNVDLTPDFYKDAVYARQLKKQWIFINGGVLAIVALILSFVFVSTLPAKSDLNNQMTLNKNLQSALAQYQDVSMLIEEKKSVETKLQNAAGNEIDWVKLIDSIQDALPGGTSMSSIGISTTDGSDKEKGATILVRFVSDSPLGYADTLQSVQSAKGISNVEISGMSSTGESYQFAATMHYDNSIKTNRFLPSDPKEGK